MSPDASAFAAWHWRPVPAIVALALFPVVQEWATGHWDAYYLAQVNFGHSFVDPFRRSWHAARLLLDGKLFTVANAPYAQTLLVTFVVVCVLLAFAFRRKAVTGFEALVAVWMLLTWVVAMLPRALAVAVIAAAVAVAIPMEVLFLRTTLV